jgi:hypothetical protein
MKNNSGALLLAFLMALFGYSAVAGDGLEPNSDDIIELTVEGPKHDIKPPP